MLKTESLQYIYRSGESFKFPDIQCAAGETHLILGPSGCGKSTLLHLMAGLLKPKSGNVSINQVDVTSLTGRKMDKFRGKNIGLIFQNPHFIESLTVRENLLLAQRLAGNTVTIEKTDEFLQQLDVFSKSNKKTANLSVGEQQRVAIARAMINRPALLLADEPTSALDDQNCQKVVRLLEEMAHQNGSALVVVTHDNRLTNYFQNKTVLN